MSTDVLPGPLKVLVFGASLRVESTNAKLASLIARLVTDAGATADLATMHEFDMPVYNGDVEAAQGVPHGALELRDRIARCDAFVISSPEYNASLPGALKNAIDWVSRVRPQPFKDKNAMLVSASPSLVGGNRGLWVLRVPLEHLGSRVYPDMFSLANAYQGFTDSGVLADAGLQERLSDTVTSFLRLVEADVRYVSLRRRWYEFLGDCTDAPITQRSQD